MKQCLICDNPIESFMSFGQMPIANGFLTPDKYSQEYFYELQIGFCPKCYMVQLTELVDRDKMFHDEYAFFSSTSMHMQRHFKDFAESILKSEYLKGSSEPFIAEIGSNDGIMLQHFANKGIRHLGYEPSKNVAEVARKKGITSVTEFFDEELAKKTVAEYGQADAFLGANVMCHIPYMHSVMKGIKILLKPKGVLVFEDPYLGSIIEKTSYDQIYDEHAFFFSVLSMQSLVKMHDLELIDVIPQEEHGGSMRYVISHKGSYKPSKSVIKQKAYEEKLGLDREKTYEAFRQNVEHSRDDLYELLTGLKNKGEKVVGYGATSKSTTVINYCNITPDLLEYICDTTPIKVGKYSPGKHIPIKEYSEFTKKYPSHALLFAWNHKKEILEKEKNYLAAGGKFITFVPKVDLL